MNRRAFIAGLTATAAGLLIPDKRVWALDRTMIAPRHPQWWYDVQAMGQDWSGRVWFDPVIPESTISVGDVIVVGGDQMVVQRVDPYFWCHRQ